MNPDPLSTIARPCTASYVLFRKDGKIAFVLRENAAWMNGYYGIAPSGKVEKNESFTAAAIRETREEVGITRTPENLHQIMVCHRNQADENMPWIDVWFEAIDWVGELTNAEPGTHSAIEWFDPNALPENIIPIHRFELEQALAGNTYCEYGWSIEKTD